MHWLTKRFVPTQQAGLPSFEPLRFSGVLGLLSGSPQGSTGTCGQVFLFAESQPPASVTELKEGGAVQMDHQLPKPLLDQAQLPEEVELYAEPGRLVVRAARGPRYGWAEAARAMRARNEDELLDEPTATKFDVEEWTW